jgi:hypothetical protein
MKILVCDDLTDRCTKLAEAVEQGLSGGVEITKLHDDKLSQQLTRLFDRVADVLRNPGRAVSDKGLEFDKADIVVVDNNLTHLRGVGRLTAEAVIGYVRCFTDAKIVVSVNKNPDVDFDLRFLVGDHQSRADVALNTNHLSNPFLWSGDPSSATNGFAPWYWPTLSTWPAHRSHQLAFIADNFEKPILPSLGFPTDASSLAFLSRHAMGALYSSATGGEAEGSKAIEEVTFRDVFGAKSRSIATDEERTALVNASANSESRSAAVKAVAADIDMWLRRDVLGPQEMLVDVPHLLLRMPFLLGSAASNASAWNDAVRADQPPFTLDQSLFAAHVEATRFKPEWSQRPTFWWPKLQQDAALADAFLAAEKKWADLVFLEDTSTFVERTNASPPREFKAEFEGSWNSRFVQRLDKYGYLPHARFMV